jgi:hypothetical protein
MLKEAIQYVVDEARDSAGAKVIPAALEPEGVYYLQTPDGKVAKVTAEPPPIRHAALDLSAVVEFAETNDASEVWYSREKVVCVLDRERRRETVTLALEYSPQLCELKKIEANPRTMDQRHGCAAGILYAGGADLHQPGPRPDVPGGMRSGAGRVHPDVQGHPATQRN